MCFKEYRQQKHSHLICWIEHALHAYVKGLFRRFHVTKCYTLLIFQANAATGLVACALLCLVDHDCVGLRFISDGSTCEKMYIVGD